MIPAGSWSNPAPHPHKMGQLDSQKPSSPGASHWSQPETYFMAPSRFSDPHPQMKKGMREQHLVGLQWSMGQMEALAFKLGLPFHRT